MMKMEHKNFTTFEYIKEDKKGPDCQMQNQIKSDEKNYDSGLMPIQTSTFCVGP